MTETETKIKPCTFWRHRWGKWIDVDEGVLRRSSDHQIVGYGIRQKRRCRYCNKVQIRVALSNRV